MMELGKLTPSTHHLSLETYSLNQEETLTNHLTMNPENNENQTPEEDFYHDSGAKPFRHYFDERMKGLDILTAKDF